jgi:lysyl-tRNA synthetase class 1
MLAPDVDYGLICNLVSTLNAGDPEVVMQYLERYDPRIREDEAFFRELASTAIDYNREVLIPRRRPYTIDRSLDPCLRLFRDELAALAETGDVTPDAIQTICFDVARRRDLPMREWFRYLYEVLLSQERGPKVGSFICLYGVPESIAKIDEHLDTSARTDSSPTQE